MLNVKVFFMHVIHSLSVHLTTSSGIEKYCKPTYFCEQFNCTTFKSKRNKKQIIICGKYDEMGSFLIKVISNKVRKS